MGFFHPYLAVHFQGQEHRTGVLQRDWFAKENDCSLNFKHRMDLPVADDGASMVNANRVKIMVHDKRSLDVRTLCLGDDLIGEGTFDFDPLQDQPQVNDRLALYRPGLGEGQSAGSLDVRWRVVRRESLSDALQNPAERTLLEVLQAMLDFLDVYGGEEAALDVFPGSPHTSKSTGSLMAGVFSHSAAKTQSRRRVALNELKEELRKQVAQYRGDEESDEEVLKSITPLVLKTVEFVAKFAVPQEQDNKFDTIDLAIRWVKDFLASAAGGGFTGSASMSRITRIFTMLELNIETLVPVDKDGGQMQGLTWRPSERDPPPFKEASLGRGGFGSVWRALDPTIKQFFAVKQMFHQGVVTQCERQNADDLRARSWQHPSLVRLYAAIDHRPNVFLVMEYCANGDLLGQIETATRRGRYDVPEKAYDWVVQIFLGLEFLHGIPFLMRDLKPQNVLLTHSLRAKIADFGLSKLAERADGLQSRIPTPGSPHYIAPEVARLEGYGKQADIYSLGVTVWHLYTGGLMDTGMPPCTAKWGEEGAAVSVLAENWTLLHNAVNEPETHRARPLPDENVKQFVLQATDRRSEGHKCTSEDLRNTDFLTQASPPLPPRGNTKAAIEWLEAQAVRRSPSFGLVAQ
uniref:Protein kinase domain-containing protein n=1 Tax=Alexandrium catenella TaxID=2925 RepID=A0A7S1RPF4_ALECA